MSKREKLLRRLLSKPKDFTFDELVTLLSGSGYEIDNKGKTSGSRILFENKISGNKFNIHKPHPKQILKPYQVAFIIDELKNSGAI